MLRTASLCVASVLWACNGQNLDVGNDPAESGGTGGSNSGGGGTSAGSPENPEAPSQTACATDPELAGLVATWEGQLEDEFFRPIQRIRIVINGASSAGLCGTVTWGDKSAPPPAEDPAAMYPPAEYWNTDPVIGLGSAVEGFPYTIATGGERVPSLRLGIIRTEPWQSFCSIQTPVFDGSSWGCVEQAGGRYAMYSTIDYSGYCDAHTSDGDHRYSQMQCEACNVTCTCDSTLCTIQKASLTLDLTLVEDGNAMTAPFGGWGPTTFQGNLNPDAGQPHAFYFERVED